MRKAALSLLASLALAVACFMPTVANAGTAEGLRRYPYLTDLVGGHVIVNWATTRTIERGVVHYGRVGNNCQGRTAPGERVAITVGTVPEFQWRASLNKLAPDTQYCYRVFGDGTNLLDNDPAPRFTSQMPRVGAKPFSFAVFGDWGEAGPGSRNDDQAALLTEVANSGVRFAVTTGDTAYQAGSQLNYGDLLQTGEDTSAIFAPWFWTKAGDSIPLFNALGNHGLNETALINWPQPRAVARSSGRYAMDRYCCVNGTAASNYPSAWYAFNAGRARFYVLDAAWADLNKGDGSLYEDDYDAHWRTTSAEYRWLQNDLQSHDGKRVKLAFFHFPMYADNATEPSDHYLTTGDSSLESLLGRYGVDIVFNGHAHIYERNARGGSGLPYSYVTGGGGGRPAPVFGCGAIDKYAIGWSFSANDGSSCGSAPEPDSASQVFHFLEVQVDGSTVTVTPTDSRGRTFDVQTYNFG